MVLMVWVNQVYSALLLLPGREAVSRQRGGCRCACTWYPRPTPHPSGSLDSDYLFKQKGNWVRIPAKLVGNLWLRDCSVWHPQTQLEKLKVLSTKQFSRTALIGLNKTAVRTMVERRSTTACGSEMCCCGCWECPAIKPFSNFAPGVVLVFLVFLYYLKLS